MVARYPLLLKLKFKDKHVKVNLPIRVKLAKIKYFNCSNCHSHGTLKQFNEYFLDSEFFKSSLNQKGYSFGSKYPKELTNKNEIYCSFCYINKKKKKVKLEPSEENKIKIYANQSLNYKYVNVLDILNHNLPFRFFSRRYNRPGLPELFAFCDDIKYMYNLLEPYIDKKEKGIKYEEYCATINMKLLEKCEEDYQKRKVLKAI